MGVGFTTMSLVTWYLPHVRCGDEDRKDEKALGTLTQRSFSVGIVTGKMPARRGGL